MKKTKQANFPNILGFEYYPEGKLLNQKIDFDGPVGIAYERCIGYTKSKHSHDRITVTFPRGSSRSFIKVFPEGKNFSLNDDLVHVMAKDHEHEQGSVSSIYDTFALFVTVGHYASHLKKLNLKNLEIESFLNSTQAFSKSAILTELLTRYFFCRVIEASPDSAEVAHLESLILTEIFMLGRGTSSQNSLPVNRSKASDETAIARAIEFIESHLFEKLDVEALVRSSRTSQATLFRLFKKELKLSPIEYVRNRRLDEAISLLKGGEYQVSDIALLVGYEDLSSFSKAFKLCFGKAPSQFLPEKSSSRTSKRG
ncbi:MAG: helix-turn-helix domain-containing protein [Bdellovibrio sp.]